LTMAGDGRGLDRTALGGVGDCVAAQSENLLKEVGLSK